MNDFGVLCHQNARIIFSNSTMSKIACFVALRRGVGQLARVGCPESRGRRAKDHFCRGATLVVQPDIPEEPESRSPKDGGRFYIGFGGVAPRTESNRVVVLRQFTSIYIVNYRQFIGSCVYQLEDCGAPQ